MKEAKITIAIPTCSSERIPLLIRMIESVQAGTYKNVHPVIVADGNPYIQKVANKKLHNVSVISNKERMDWVFSMNRVFREWDSEYYIYASDDLVFPPHCIKKAMQTMQQSFPDGFGVVTITKKNRCPFGLIGRKLVEYFPDRQVFCPDYIHYRSDTEFQKTVKELKIFAFPPERTNQVEHLRRKDGTWRLANKIKSRDSRIFNMRQEKGYLWGIDFNRVTQ